MRPLGRKIYYLIGVSIVVMLIAGAMLVMPVLADEGPAAGSNPSPNGQTREQNAKAAYQDFITKLAANLGISDTATVNSGVKSALSQMVDERQQDGTLSQAQADMLKQRINAEEFPSGFPGRMGGHHGHWMIGKRFFDMDELASFFGESATDLKTELQQGNSLTTIGEKHGKSRDALKTFLTDQFKAHASQAESDAQKRFQDNLDELIDRSWPIKQPSPSPSATT